MAVDLEGSGGLQKESFTNDAKDMIIDDLINGIAQLSGLEEDDIIDWTVTLVQSSGDFEYEILGDPTDVLYLHGDFSTTTSTPGNEIFGEIEVDVTVTRNGLPETVDGAPLTWYYETRDPT